MLGPRPFQFAMVKWADLVHKILNFDDSTPVKKAAKALANMPTFMSILEANYRASYIKTIVKSRFKRVVDKIDTDAFVIQSEPDQLADHMVKVISPYANCSDPLVSRWGRICEELANKRDVLLFLSTLAEDDEQIVNAMHAVMNWTLSECNRRRCPVMPFVEKR
jgi:hypothetical protein|tara:strand:- start:2323 stop:2814 length:492 start_codon:yes stop_codon:yes gene_type:complete